MGRIGAGVLLVSTLLFLFQNCGKAGFENQEMIESLSTAETIDPKLSKLPFPYEVSVNQIAHMSCPLNLQPDSVSPYFSWKAGAFDNPPEAPSYAMNIRPSGLQLSPAFLEQWQKLSSTYNPAIVEKKLKEALTTLPSVQGAQLQMSFRKTNLPKTEVMAMPAGGFTSPAKFMDPVSSDTVANAFLKQPEQIYNFFPDSLNFMNRPLEVSMIVPSAYGFNDQALKANYDASFLTIGYINSNIAVENEIEKLMGPGDDPRFAYGKGFRVRFGQANPHQETAIYPSSDSLGYIEEFDLETGARTAGVGWDCSFKFKIVRPQDRYNPIYRANHFQTINGVCPVLKSGTYCPSPVNPQFGIPIEAFSGQCPSNRGGGQPITGQFCEEHYYAACPDEPHTGRLDHPNAIQREDGIYHQYYPERPAILHALRRFLPVGQWDINVSRRCIVPKMDDNACYGSSPVVYDEYFWKGLNVNAKLGMYAGCGPNSGQYQCANYLTLCVRR